MKSENVKYKKWIVALFLSATLLMSCHNNKVKLSSIDDDKNVPTMEMDSLKIEYTEKGLLRMDLRAPSMQRFMLAEEPYSEFNKGIHIYFYTATRELESEIVADYALNKEKPEELWKATGNVVITNYTKQQTLYTDTLYWNREQQIIYTDAFVRIVTPDSEIKGLQGMTSDERFSDYEIRTVRESHVLVNEEAESDSTNRQEIVPITNTPATTLTSHPTKQEEQKSMQQEELKPVSKPQPAQSNFKKQSLEKADKLTPLELQKK